MRIGVVGRPGVGKTTLFRLLTAGGRFPAARAGGTAIGVMEVPDFRVDWLTSVYHPRKSVYARMELLDIQPFNGQEFLNVARNLDTVLLVIGSFMASQKDAGDQAGALDDLDAEFFVADLLSVENRMERLSGNKAKLLGPGEIPFLEKCKEALDRGIPLRKVEFPNHERGFLANYAFFTAKQVIAAVNVSEEFVSGGDYPGKSYLERKAQEESFALVTFSGEVETEIASLPIEERLGFMQAYGLQETGVSRIARAAYRGLGMISFLTIGDDEVRAWTIPYGTSAKEAAGKIHSDMEKGFIRAEVVSFEVLKTWGSFKACRDKGQLRVEGKDYIVKDGDILNIRFNV